MTFLCSVLSIFGIALLNEIRHANLKKAPAKHRLPSKKPIL
ncbi:hypothetical protein QUF84_06085 [Fictibacillus enclensis]|nr:MULTISPECIES: hypothetical protein [Fictibacillus]MDM5336780.1 hypothetical protein [Fictibacillus enclensis]WHY73210.1 hypothetical protein QNH15_04640 [Fictibacillus enclensis]SCB72215.1 hypothetical protein GA0061096_0051 [Fictibacillus enclensis]